MKAPATLSPLGLLQEQVERGPLYGWRVLVVCFCLDKVRGSRAGPVVETLFTRWPTPEEMAAAEDDLEKTLEPLGMQSVRAKNLRAMSAVWRDGEWADPQDLPGVGPYALTAWRIFVDRELPEQEPTDGWLAAYWRWAINTQRPSIKFNRFRRNPTPLFDGTVLTSLPDGYINKVTGRPKPKVRRAPEMFMGDAVLTPGQCDYITGVAAYVIQYAIRDGKMRGRKAANTYLTTWRALLDWCEGKDAGMPRIIDHRSSLGLRSTGGRPPRPNVERDYRGRIVKQGQKPPDDPTDEPSDP